MDYRSLKLIEECIKPTQPTTDMIDLWQSLCKEKLGRQIQVMLADRKENPSLADLSGNLNIAHPHLLSNGTMVLVVWLDSMNEIDEVVLTHEVGHWILLLEGFRAFLHSNPDMNLSIGSFFQALLHHPPLYHLQKKLGHDPQNLVDSLAVNYITEFSQNKERAATVTRNALIAADSLINCSNAHKKALTGALKKRHTRTMKLIRRIITLRHRYNILDRESNHKWGAILIKELGLGTGWSELIGRDFILSLWKSS